MVLPCNDAVPAERVIKEGDLVVVYESYTSIKAVYVNSKEIFQNRFGKFMHRDWLGKPFGSRVTARGGSSGCGWVFLLAPTPELWTQVLRHRTQILYVADIALVVANLGLSPGKTVLESGTGSGSLTHSLARAVAPTGHVHTFDFHEQRAQEARAEFQRHGLGGLVTVQQRNIEEQGFPEALRGAADAVFLDLPGPWKVVASAAASLKPGGCFCSFSPCIEQVQRTCEQLDRHGFVDIHTLEILLRTYEVSRETLHSNISRAPMPNKQSKKRSRTALAAAAAAAAAEEEEAAAAAAAAAAGGDGGGDSSSTAAAAAAAAAASSMRQVLAQPSMEARGHTGFLTFARRFVAAVPLAGYDGEEDDEEEEEQEQEQQEQEQEQQEEKGARAEKQKHRGDAAGGGGGGGGAAAGAKGEDAAVGGAHVRAAQMTPAALEAAEAEAAAAAEDELEMLY